MTGVCAQSDAAIKDEYACSTLPVRGPCKGPEQGGCLLCIRNGCQLDAIHIVGRPWLRRAGTCHKSPLPRAMTGTTLSKKCVRLMVKVAIAVAQLYLVHMLQRTLPAGFIAPCLPTKTDRLPSGDLWLHEIKHDGFRVTGSAFYRLALACGETRTF